MANKKPFEKIFPYFSYRWRYDDGQYSVYAPFTQTQFVSDEPDVTDYFKKGHNTSVSNTLKVMNITNIPRGGPDVVAIDLLYRESISSTVYILKTIEIPEINRGIGFESAQITKRAFSSALPDDQLSRHFDNVPLKAKSQEITANRLIYGNYVHKYDIDHPLEIELGVNPIPQPHNGPSVKTNRTYEVGVAYIDKFGRIGNLLTQKVTDGNNGSSIDTDFSYRNRIALTSVIKSPAPYWATHYRYYVKDVSNDHFNLSAFNVYNDGASGDTDSDNVYLQFNSSDRNKITDETVLIPRRHNFEGSDVFFAEESRHPVLDIENEAPDIVRNQVNERVLSSAGITITDEYANTYDPITAVGSGGSLGNPNHSTVIGDTQIAVGDTANGFGSIIANINKYILSQDPDANQFTIDSGSASSSLPDQLVDVSEFPDRLALKFKARYKQDDAQYTTSPCLVDSIKFIATNGNKKKRNVIVFTISTRLDEKGNPLEGTGAGDGLDKGSHTMDGNSKREDLKFYKLGLSEEGQDKLKGSFFVKVPRDVTGTTNLLGLPTAQTEYDEDGKVSIIKELNFETEPLDDSNLDLYWESGETFSIINHGSKEQLEWANCIGTKTSETGTIYLESSSIFDQYNSVKMAKGTRVLTPETRYAQERRKAGLIFSGLYNSKTGVNELNQFNMSLNPTKELEPNYGGIQKLYTLDTNLLAFAEDKIFRVLADKDALFNADDGVNVTATHLVLGQAMVYQGNYGISTNPESFAYFRNNIYFSDAKRGAVLQLTPANGQIFPISSKGMSNFFSDRIGTANKIIGAYDGSKKMYVISMQGYDPNAASIGSEVIEGETSNITVGYSLRGEGWASRYSFIPEAGITMNNKFYTFKSGQPYLHNSDSGNRNTFYGVFTPSEVEVIFNDQPSATKKFLALSYEGDSNWVVNKIDPDGQDTPLITNWPFVKKDDKYFAPIVSRVDYYGGTDQSLGSATADDGSTVYVQGQKDKSGVNGFYNKVRLKNNSTSKVELFAINAEGFITQD